MLRPSPRSTLLPYTTLFRSFVEPDEWFEKVPGYLRQGTNPIEKTRYLDRICDIVGRLNDWENVTTRSDLPTGFKGGDRKSTRLNSSHTVISYAVFCLKKKKY